MSLVSWHSSRLRRGARSSSAAEAQAAARGDDEAVYIRLCLKEFLFGQLDLQNWQSEARQIPAALVVDCRGVYDALARSSSSCLGLKDKKSGLEALALKQSLVECGTMIRWCHSAAQLGDVATKGSDTARAPWELLVRRGCRWKMIHDHKFDQYSARSEECHADYVTCMSSQFSQPRFLHTCSGLRFLASMILNIVMHLCWFCAS